MIHRLTRTALTAAAALALAASALAVDSKDNAALRYWMAWSLISEADDNSAIDAAAPDSPDFKPTDELLAFLAAKHDVITLLREAGQFPACDFAVDLKKGPFALLTYLRPVRTSTRLLLLDARVRADANDTPAAVADITAALRMQRHLAGTGEQEGASFIIGALVTASTFDATSNLIRSLHDQGKLDADAKRAISEVLDSFNPDDPFAVRAGVETERRAMVEWFALHVVADAEGQRALTKLSEEALGELDDQQRGLLEILRDAPDLNAELDMYDLYYKHVLTVWDHPDANERLSTINKHAQEGGYGHFANLLAPALMKVHENWQRSVETLRATKELLAP